MKRLLIGDSREELLSTLEVILRHMGYRVLVSSRPDQLKALLRETSPDLLIMGARLLNAGDGSLAEAVNHQLFEGSSALIVLREEQVESTLAEPHETLDVPLDLFSLFALVQKHLEEHPRRNLRLAIQLPALLCAGEKCHIADVLSLSIHGLLVKTGYRPAKGDSLRVVFPLMGMKKELELGGRVLYQVEPTPGNNYFQGIGIEFTNLTEETCKQLEEFLEQRFLGDLAERPEVARILATDQLKERTNRVTLRLTPA